MKDNKNHPTNNLVNNFTIASSNLAKVIPFKNPFNQAKQTPVVPKEENAKPIRRYSFDDNGGGYLGL